MAKKTPAPVEPVAPEIISRREAAKLLGVHPVAMKALMARDGLPQLVPRGHSMAFVKSEVETYSFTE